VHVFLTYRPNLDVSKIMQWLKGISSKSFAPGVSAFAKEVLGPPLLGSRVAGGKLLNHPR
jgi:REP element-mobilizing transposase RayT